MNDFILNDLKIDLRMDRANSVLRESILYETINNVVRCNTCERFCEIEIEDFGFCKTRKNIAGKLYTIYYGNISSHSANPIEKKPFFHFYPGSFAFTVGGWGCNFSCPWCQNYEISKVTPAPNDRHYISPNEFIELLKNADCQGTSISFNEPTLLLEYSLDVFKLARKEGFYNTYVTNGYMSSKALKLLIDCGLDALNFDMKGDPKSVKKYCNAEVENVWRNIEDAKKSGMHVEITTLIIPGINDCTDSLQYIAKRIRKDVGVDTPWHLTQYHPSYKAFDIGLYPRRTPVQTLEMAWKIGKDEGLNYVYVGNIFGHKFENTYCHNCEEILIQRVGFDIIDYKIKPDKKCPKCKEIIPIVGNFIKR